MQLKLINEETIVNDLTNTYAESIIINADEWDNQMKVNNNRVWLNNNLIEKNRVLKQELNNYYQNFITTCFCGLVFYYSKTIIKDTFLFYLGY